MLFLKSRYVSAIRTLRTIAVQGGAVAFTGMASHKLGLDAADVATLVAACGFKIEDLRAARSGDWAEKFQRWRQTTRLEWHD